MANPAKKYRLNKLEQRTPEQLPEIHVQLCETKDHAQNPDRYQWTPVPSMSKDGIMVEQPTPKN